MEFYNEILSQAPKSGYLYHYTNQRGLLGILSNKEMWASNIRYLNDSKEFDAAIDLATDYIDTLLSEATDELTTLILKAVSSYFKSSSVVDVCVCSFSSKGDSLDQWRGYCDGGSGYAIGFKYDTLSSLCQSQGFVLGRCLYDPLEQKKLIAELVNDFVLKYITASTSDDSTTQLLKVTATISERIYRYAPLIKNKSFSSEKEWRLISLPNNLKGRPLRFREGPSMLIPYYDFALVRNKKAKIAVEDLVVGPCPNIQLALDSALRLLLREGCYGLLARKSEVPMRNW